MVFCTGTFEKFQKVENETIKGYLVLHTKLLSPTLKTLVFLKWRPICRCLFHFLKYICHKNHDFGIFCTDICLIFIAFTEVLEWRLYLSEIKIICFVLFLIWKIFFSYLNLVSLHFTFCQILAESLYALNDYHWTPRKYTFSPLPPTNIFSLKRSSVLYPFLR